MLLLQTDAIGLVHHFGVIISQAKQHVAAFGSQDGSSNIAETIIIIQITSIKKYLLFFPLWVEEVFLSPAARGLYTKGKSNHTTDIAAKRSMGVLSYTGPRFDPPLFADGLVNCTPLRAHIH